MHVDDPFYQLRAASINYSIAELKSLMLDARVTLIDGKFTIFDRKSKNLKFEAKNKQHYHLNYDILVIAESLVDKTVKELLSNEKSGLTKEIQHVYSIDNPYLYDIFAPSKDANSPYCLLTHKKRPQNICVYGASLHTYAFISGLIKLGVSPERIFLVIPPRAYDIATKFNSNAERIAYEDSLINNPEAFNDNVIRKAI